jgi:hypothetical protein
MLIERVFLIVDVVIVGLIHFLEDLIGVFFLLFFFLDYSVWCGNEVMEPVVYVS